MKIVKDAEVVSLADHAAKMKNRDWAAYIWGAVLFAFITLGVGSLCTLLVSK